MKRLLIVVLSVVSAGDTLACTISPHSTAKHRPNLSLNEADFVFRGVVLSQEAEPMDESEYEALVRSRGRDKADVERDVRASTLTVAFEVDRVWKGDVGTPFSAINYLGFSCSLPLIVGAEYIVFGSLYSGSHRVTAVVMGDDLERVALELTRGFD